jgi:hypothetical protein
MSDLDITIKLDPAQPVAGAKAVTAELAKTETQAKKTEDAAAGIAKLNFKQAAAGAAQAFELLNQKLKITDNAIGNVVGSSIKFAAMGAQMAGPYGAAAGAIVGASLEMGGALEGFIEIAEEAEEGVKTLGERLAILTKDSTSLGGQFRALTGGARTMGEAFELVTLHLQMLHDATNVFSSLTPALAAVNAQLAAQKKILGELNDPRTKLLVELTALQQLRKNGEITAIDYVNAESKLITSAAQHEGVVVKVAKAYEELEANQRRVFGNMAILTEASGREAGPAGLNGNGEFVPDAQAWNIGKQPGVGAENEQELGRQRDMINFRTGQAQAQYEWKKKEAEEAKKLEEAVGSIDDVFKSSLVSSAQTFSSALVDAANGADVSWTSTLSSMAQGLQKAITQALILKALTGSYTGAAGANGAAIGGLFSALGFASGGTIYPSGSGSTDSMAVSFRKRPDETVHINTPSQERAYQQGSGGNGPVGVTIIDGRDARALPPSRADHTVFLDNVRANASAIAALLPRR